jgi:putative ABC transport system permease protein
MLKSYLKIALRNLWKNRLFSLINVTGLALGLACALLIVFHVRQELSYDKGFKNADRIYRVTLTGKGENDRSWAAISYPMPDAMRAYFPQSGNIVRFYRPYPHQVLSSTGADNITRKFEEKGGFFADPAAISMFDIEFITGDKATALNAPASVIISEKTARKYFGTTDATGKILQDEINHVPLKVTGVVREYSFPSHLQFDYLLSMSTIHRYLDDQSLSNRTWNAFYTYILPDNAAAVQKIRTGLKDFTAKYYEENGKSAAEILADRQLDIQPVTDIHLYSHLEKEMSLNSNATYVKIFSLAALFILLVAAVNFINLYTAQAFSRMKEVGMRKVIGATYRQVITQFLGESLITTLLAAVLAVVLFKSAIPLYDRIAERPFYANEILTLPGLGITVLLVLFIALLAGGYPAWYIAHFHPVNALKAKHIPGSQVNNVRKGMVIFQFVVSVFMIICTIIIYRQVRFFHQKDLGFDKEQVAGITIYGPMWQQLSTLMNEIKQSPDIAGFSGVSTLPGDRFSSQPFQPLEMSGQEADNSRIMWSDERLLATLQIPLLEGRNFFNQYPAVKQNEFILNEAAVKAYHLAPAVGQRCILDGDTGTVVGVIKDFNFASLHTKVDPLVIKYDPYRTNYLLIKIKSGRIPAAMKYMKDKFTMLAPGVTFTYTFIDDKLNHLYATENRMSSVFKAFAAFAVLLSCMGLFGLSAYTAQLRRKEICIRKILGASSTYIALLLSRDFIKLVFIAVLISCPIAWWAMHTWLSGFAYHIAVNGWIFVAAGLFALLTAFLAVTYQAGKAALSNPVKHLKAT